MRFERTRTSPASVVRGRPPPRRSRQCQRHSEDPQGMYLRASGPPPAFAPTARIPAPRTPAPAVTGPIAAAISTLRRRRAEFIARACSAGPGGASRPRRRGQRLRGSGANTQCRRGLARSCLSPRSSRTMAPSVAPVPYPMAAMETSNDARGRRSVARGNGSNHATAQAPLAKSLRCRRRTHPADLSIRPTRSRRPRRRCALMCPGASGSTCRTVFWPPPWTIWGFPRHLCAGG